MTAGSDGQPADQDEPSGGKEASAASAGRPFNPDGGEDESSTDDEGADKHLHDDQKPIA